MESLLPSLAGIAKDVTLAHLLAHTAGYAAWEPLWERLRERFSPKALWQVPVNERQRAMREIVMRIKPDAKPGVQAIYSDVSFLLLGFALEEVTQMSLDQAVRRFVFEQLGMREAFYRHVNAESATSRLGFVAATEDSAWRGGILQGQVHDDNCWAMGGYAGHAGMFGTVRDVLQFARALYPRPAGAGSLSPETLSAVWTRVAPPLGPKTGSRTLGWDTPSGDDPSASRLFSSR